jgi:hypothetical protein
VGDVDVMYLLIDRLRAQLKRKPSGYRQDQLAKAQAELCRRSGRRVGKSHVSKVLDEFMEAQGKPACLLCSGKHWKIYHGTLSCPRAASDAASKSP